MKNITNDYTVILQDFRELPNADRYTLKSDELAELMETAKHKPFETIGYSWHKGFTAGIRYCKNQQKQKKKHK